MSTFISGGELYYTMISEKRIREIIRDEISKGTYVKFYGDTKIPPKSYLENSSEWLSANDWSKRVQELEMKENLARDEIPEIIDKETSPFNESQMINGTFKGDSIHQKGKMAKRRANELEDKIFKPPGECMNTDKEENLKMRSRIRNTKAVQALKDDEEKI